MYTAKYELLRCPPHAAFPAPNIPRFPGVPNPRVSPDNPWSVPTIPECPTPDYANIWSAQPQYAQRTPRVPNPKVGRPTQICRSYSVIYTYIYIYMYVHLYVYETDDSRLSCFLGKSHFFVLNAVLSHIARQSGLSICGLESNTVGAYHWESGVMSSKLSQVRCPSVCRSVLTPLHFLNGTKKTLNPQP